ncbi:hypothetical protein PspR76_25425 [Pseudomonas sp. R76]|nr:hypothetical protein PspR76_25425 [Pseudomonas sp. R76]
MDQLWDLACGELACVGAGLPAMQAPRTISHTEAMLSRASPLPHKPGSHIKPAPTQAGTYRVNRARRPAIPAGLRAGHGRQSQKPCLR